MAPLMSYSVLQRDYRYCVHCRLDVAKEYLGADVRVAKEGWRKWKCYHTDLDSETDKDEASIEPEKNKAIVWVRQQTKKKMKRKRRNQNQRQRNKKKMTFCKDVTHLEDVDVVNINIAPIKAAGHMELDGYAVINLVLPLLPLRAIARARVVCKSLNQRVFVDPVLYPPLHSPHLAIGHRFSATRSGIAVHDACTNQWLHIPIDLVSSPQMSRGGFVGGYLCAASGGLFCFIDEHSRSPANGILVGNPLSRKWKFLPALPAIIKPVPHHGQYYSEDEDEKRYLTPYTEPYLMAMSADARTGNFKVFLLSFTSYKEIVDEEVRLRRVCITQVYNSISSTWEKRSPIASRRAYYHSHGNGVHDGKLYAVDYSFGTIVMLLYDLEKHTYQEVPFRIKCYFDYPTCREESFVCRLPRVSVWQGRVFCVGVCFANCTPKAWNPPCQILEEDVGKIPIAQYGPIGIWEFYSELREMKLLSVAPLNLMKDMIDAHPLGTDFIVANRQEGHQIWLLLEGNPRVLEYDLPSGTWSILECGCPRTNVFDTRNRTAVYTPMMWPFSM